MLTINEINALVILVSGVAGFMGFWWVTGRIVEKCKGIERRRWMR